MICKLRRTQGVVVCCWESMRRARNDVERGAAMINERVRIQQFESRMSLNYVLV